MKFTATSGGPDIDPGVYEAEFDGCSLKKLDEPTQFGQTELLIWAFTAYDNGEPVEIEGTTSTATGPKSKSNEFVRGLLGGRQPDIGEEIDLDAMVGTRVQVVVTQEEGKWAKVTQVLPLPKKRGA